MRPTVANLRGAPARVHAKTRRRPPAPPRFHAAVFPEPHPQPRTHSYPGLRPFGVRELGYAFLSATSRLASSHCKSSTSPVYSFHVDLYPEERAPVHLLYVLYACVFWRGEAELLKF